MKKIGIIGGVGPQATANLYKEIIEYSNSKYNAVNNNDYPRIVIESVPVPDFIRDKKTIEEAKRMLIDAGINLINAKCSTLAIASGTVHLLFDEIQNELQIEMISMIEAVVKFAVVKESNLLGIIATPTTINSKLFERKLNEQNINVIKPSPDELEVIEIIIRQVLAGENSFTDKEKYRSIITRMLDTGADRIILGCTELPLAIHYNEYKDKIINAPKVLAEALVDYYYQNK